MRILHISDLHIGKRVNDFPMIDDQKYILNKILSAIKTQNIDIIIIAGDVYDKPIPSAEAVTLFDSFLKEIYTLGIKTFIISGNHDSPERLAFGHSIMEGSGIYFSPVYNGSITPITLSDSFGNVDIYMLPYVKPAIIRSFFKDTQITDMNQALKTVIASISLNKNHRNILIAHQFITGATKSESEEIYVGGLENVDADIFSEFDYVALGHIHKPQSITPKIRYCGTPLKYSISEEHHEKSITIADLTKTDLNITKIPLIPLRDMRTIEGSYMELTSKDFYKDTNTEDYIYVVLTDDNEVYDAIGRLRSIYPNIMRIEYKNNHLATDTSITTPRALEASPLDMVLEFYKLQTDYDMNESQKDLCKTLIENIWEEYK